MKKYLSLFFVVILSSHLFAEDKLRFLDSISAENWENVKALAAKENKFIFVDIYMDNCKYCTMMEEQTFTNSIVAKLMNENFISVHYNITSEVGNLFNKKYRIKGFPALFIFTPKGELTEKLSGYLNEDIFLSKLNNILTAKKHKNISSTLNPVFPDFYLNSLLKENTKIDSATVNNFLDTTKNLSDEVSFSVMYRFTQLLNTKHQQFIIDNLSWLKKMYGDDDVETLVLGLSGIKLRESIKLNDEKKMEDILAFMEKNLSERNKKWKDYIKIHFYGKTKEWKNFAETMNECIKKPLDVIDESMINSYSWNIYQQCDDQVIISQATNWMKDIVTKTPQHNYLYTYSSLLYKSQNLPEAKKYAELAVETGKKENEHTEETEKLLEKINNEMKNYD